jgi:HK97 family phage major capsid protein
MSDVVLDAVKDLRSTWEAELKPRIDQMEAEQKTNGEAAGETKAAISQVQDRMDALEAQIQKAALAPVRTADEKSQDRKDLEHFIRQGSVPAESKLLSHKSDMQTKVLAIRDESLGGVLAPADFINEVIKAVVQYSPVRGLVRVRPTSRTSIMAPKRTGNFAAAWTAEIASRPETTGRTYGLEEIPTHEMYARVVVSNWDLEDAVVDLEGDVRDSMAEQFAVTEGAACISGNGVGKPEGFLVNTDVIASPVLNGGATFANADGIIKLAFTPKEQYWSDAQFVLNRFSLRDIRLLKDSAGNYLWQPAADGVHGVSTGLPATLYGYPYTIAVDMPSAGANNLTVGFGSFTKAYWMVDRLEISVLRDPYTAAANGELVLHARKRVGGQVVLPEAIAVLKMA